MADNFYSKYSGVGGGGGGSGANTALSNLTNPTAINQDLLFGADATNTIGAASGVSRPMSLFVSDIVSAGYYPNAAGHTNVTMINTMFPAINFYDGGSDAYTFGVGASGLSIKNVGTASTLFNSNNTGFMFADNATNTVYFNGDASGNLQLKGNILDQSGVNSVDVNDRLLMHITTGTPAVSWDRAIELTTDNQSVSSSYHILSSTGTSTGDQSNTGDITTVTGNASAGSSGQITVQTGTAADSSIGASNTGQITIQTGDNSGTGDTGAITLHSGNAVTGNTSDITLLTGVVTDVTASSVTGGVAIVSGENNGTGPSGDITLDTGSTGGGQRGSILLGGLTVVMTTHTVDPTGTIQAGAMYFNTTVHKLKVYNGTTWETITSV